MLAGATMNQIKPTPPAIVVHGRDDAHAAVAAARALGVPLTLVSAPGAGGYAGAGWFLGLVSEAAAQAPELAVSGILDCADDAGHALAALRAGVQTVVFTGAPETADTLDAIAAATTAAILRARPAACDPGDAVDKEAACRAWLRRR